MATPLGVKTFLDGQVLLDTELNGYLMAQVIAAFDNASARDAAITSPAEGNFAYLRDRNEVFYYDGAAWVQLAGAEVGDQFLLMGA